jgi:hypothetical protein
LRKLGIILLAVALLILLTTRSGPSGLPAAYDPLDSSWKGCSEFFRILREEYSAKLLTTDYSILSQYRDAVLILLGPTEEFSDSEYAQLVNFVRAGGILVLVADIDGTGSSLDFFGVHIQPELLRDPGSYDKRPDFVVLKDLRGEMFSGVSQILTNYPSYLVTTEKNKLRPTLDAVAYSTRQAYPDVNGNGVQDSWEKSGSYAVVAALSYPGFSGKVVFVADPGIFINDIIQRNLPFVHSLLKWVAGGENVLPLEGGARLSEGRAILVDLTHTGYRPERWLWLAWLTDKFLAISFVTVVAVAWRGLAGRQKPRPRPEGRLKTEMRRCLKLYMGKTRSDFSFPLLACYKHFLRKCGRLMGVGPTTGEVLGALESNLPSEARRIRKVIATCHLVEQGILSVDTETSEKLISTLNEIERKVEAWSKK